ncbi:MAG: glucose 1-dehydrogenase [Actinomycetota bacterium]
MGRLDDKVALITGGARGQGGAEARRFVEEGATVRITDVLHDDGGALADELGGAASYRPLDVRNAEEWKTVVDEIVAEYGRLDVLINNAGIFQIADMASTTEDDWHRMLDINQTGVFLGMKTVAPQMKEQGGGSIVNISSIAGLQGTGMAFAYGATKWAVRGMTKSAAQELGPFGVRVNSIHPGIIETPMLEQLGGDGAALTESRTPLGRAADADEVAKLALFLASDESSYSTGSEFVIDGGWMA